MIKFLSEFDQENIIYLQEKLKFQDYDSFNQTELSKRFDNIFTLNNFPKFQIFVGFCKIKKGRFYLKFFNFGEFSCFQCLDEKIEKNSRSSQISS